jgi:hypothetical protein
MCPEAFNSGVIVDFPSGETFCWCFVLRSVGHFFVSSVLFTDEARFGRDSIINIHNQHQWAERLHIV